MISLAQFNLSMYYPCRIGLDISICFAVNKNVIITGRYIQCENFNCSITCYIIQIVMIYVCIPIFRKAIKRIVPVNADGIWTLMDFSAAYRN